MAYAQIKGKQEQLLFDLTKNQIKWQEKRRFLSKNKDSFDTKLQAISDILTLDIKRTKNVDATIIIVFTDFQMAIIKILDLKARVNRNVV